MFRFVQRFKVNTSQKIKKSRPVCNAQWESESALDDTTHSQKVYSETFDYYFTNSDRYKSFCKNSVRLHQFDDETHNVAVWNRKSSTNPIRWNCLPQEYSTDDLIQAFGNMIEHNVHNGITLSDPMYDGFVDEFIKQMNKLTLNEIVRAFQMFARAPLEKKLIRQRNYIDLCMAFDQTLTIKSINIRPNQILFLSSIWRHIPHARKSYFSQLSDRLLNRYLKIMSAPEISEALFYLNCLNKPVENIRAFENIFEKTMHDMNLQELAIVMWTFRRIDTKVQKCELRSKLYSFLEHQDFDQLEDSFLLRIVNFLAERPPKTSTEIIQMKSIIRNISNTLDQRSIHVCVLVASMGAPVRIFEDETNAILFRQCLNQPDVLSNLNLSALEKLSRIVDLCPGDSKTLTKIGHLILEQVTNRLSSIADQLYYGINMNIIRNLLSHDVCDLELLDCILKPEYIKKMNNSKQLYLSVYEIDAYTRINLKDIYNGNQLADTYLARIKYLIEFAPDQVNKYKKGEKKIYEIENVIKKRFEHYTFAHAVAHHRFADTFVCINKKTLESKDVSNNYPPRYTGKTFEASRITENDDNLLIFAFIAANAKYYQNSIAVGYLRMKCKQLSRLGFHTIIIPPWERNVESLIVQEMNKKLEMMGIQKEFKIH